MLRNRLAIARVGCVWAVVGLVGTAAAVADDGPSGLNPTSTTVSAAVKPTPISVSVPSPVKPAVATAVSKAAPAVKSAAKAAHHEPLPEFLLPRNTKGFLAVANITEHSTPSGTRRNWGS